MNPVKADHQRTSLLVLFFYLSIPLFSVILFLIKVWEEQNEYEVFFFPFDNNNIIIIIIK